VTVGGRVLSVDSLSRTVTLDREVEIPPGGNVVLNLVGSDGQPVTVAVTAHPTPDRVTVSQLPEGVAAYSVWGLKLPDLRQRLFRCVGIRENDDGTYAITAVQHVPEKESIVDNGAKFDPLPGASITNTPPAVRHLTTEILAEGGQYQARARWDTPRVVKGVNFSLRLTVKAEDNSNRLASSLTLTETEHTFRNLTPGRYTLTVRAVNSQGQQGEPASTDFSIAAPAVPSYVELTPGYFQITATPRQAVYDPSVQYEFWFTDTQITDIRQVESDARYLGTALYWIAANASIKPGKDYYFYIRAVNQVGKSAFVEAVGQVSNDAEGVLDILKNQLSADQMTTDFLSAIDNKVVKEEVEEALSASEARVDEKLELLGQDTVVGILPSQTHADTGAFVLTSRIVYVGGASHPVYLSIPCAQIVTHSEIASVITEVRCRIVINDVTRFDATKTLMARDCWSFAAGAMMNAEEKNTEVKIIITGRMEGTGEITLTDTPVFSFKANVPQFHS